MVYCGKKIAKIDLTTTFWNFFSGICTVAVFIKGSNPSGILYKVRNYWDLSIPIFIFEGSCVGLENACKRYNSTRPMQEFDLST